MSRLRWPDSTNSVSEKPGTIQNHRPRVMLSSSRFGHLGTQDLVCCEWSHDHESVKRVEQLSGQVTCLDVDYRTIAATLRALELMRQHSRPRAPESDQGPSR